MVQAHSRKVFMGFYIITKKQGSWPRLELLCEKFCVFQKIFSITQNGPERISDFPAYSACSFS